MQNSSINFYAEVHMLVCHGWILQTKEIRRSARYEEQPQGALPHG